MASRAGHRGMGRMLRHGVQVAGGCLLLALFVLASARADDPPQALFYRYTDSRGVTVLDRQGVPPEYVGKGYEVLNARGRVVQVVPPAPSADELRQAEAAKAQASADAQLLHLYPDVADVDRARARKLAEIDALIGVAQGNLQGLGAQQASLQGQAADQERAGRAVPQALLDQLNDLRDQKQGLQASIDRYQQARQEAEAGFAQDRLQVQKLLQP